MGKMAGKVLAEASQGHAYEDRRSPSDERSREEEVVSTHEGALGREEEVRLARFYVSQPLALMPSDSRLCSGCDDRVDIEHARPGT